MSRFTQIVRNRRNTAKTRRAVNRALDRAATPAVRDELRAMALAQGLSLR